jgi:luciferase family oxidoreductase group 1
VWILGSSLFGAQLAAYLGLPYAFASHFAPAQMMEAIALYRARFKPSRHLDKPHVMLGYNVFAADTDDEARFLATSWQQSFINLRTGRPSRLPPPLRGYAESLPPVAQQLLDHILSCTAIGGPDTVAAQMQAFLDKTQPDELIVTCNMYDHAARLRSFDIVAQVHGQAQAGER